MIPRTQPAKHLQQGVWRLGGRDINRSHFVFLRQGLKLVCTSHTSRSQTFKSAFASGQQWFCFFVPLPVPPETALTPARSTLCTFPRIQVPRLEDTFPINHLYCTPIVRGSQPGLSSHACWADFVCCLQPLIPALIVGLCIIAT